MKLANSKSILAKLLAQENISVEHRKSHTAYFDPKNRVLVLPIWKDMSANLYDLLVAHEVGHAWETPPEGWHDAITEHGSGFRSYLNVIEDVRIEKAIKVRYPGLRNCMYKGYSELMDMDFFGVHQMKIESLPLIDRINLHYKIGPFFNVKFNTEENYFISKIDKISTWDDVLKIALELFEHQKEINSELDQLDELEYSEDGDFYEDFDDSDEDDTDKTSKGNRGGRKSEPFSYTDKVFRSKEKTLISSKSNPYVYVNLPILKVKDFLVPHQELYQSKHFVKLDSIIEDLKILDSSIADDDFIKNYFNPNSILQTYKENNQKFIQYLVKEFELRRNAAQFARASVSKSGELDLDKVYGYKFKEDLFKRVTKLPNGKNHAMIMFVDWSGSMNDYMFYTIEQALVLADFCKKVNIPFEVLAFSNSEGYSKNVDTYKYSRRNKDIYLNDNKFRIHQLLSNTMSLSQYRNAQIRLLQIGKAYSFKNNDFNTYKYNNFRSLVHNAISSLWLTSGTPLNEAIIFANYYVSEYKQSHKTDVMNVIFLTDGDGAELIGYWDDSDKYRYKIFGSEQSVGRKTVNLVITDTQTKNQSISYAGKEITTGLLELLKKNVDCNLIGYFIYTSNPSNVTGRIVASYCNEILNVDELIKKNRKNKFICIPNAGYNKYFLVQSKELEIKADIFKDKVLDNKREIAKAFIKNQQNKFINRILLNSFIAEIA